jgi:hypothetical protein
LVFADGATGAFTSELALANAGSTPATVRVTAHLRDGGTRRTQFAVPPLSRTTLDVNQWLASQPEATFSTRLEADQDGMAVERFVRWSAQPGAPSMAGHAAAGVAPSRTWYFADGSTQAVDTFLVLANPEEQPAQVSVEFVRPQALPLSRGYVLAPHARLTLHANAIPELANSTFWMRAVSDVPIAAERATYITRNTGMWTGGDIVPGVATPSRTWFFAEGVTGTYFDTYFVLANPQGEPVSVELTWLRPGAPPIRQTRTLAAGTRESIHADTIDGLTFTPLSLAIGASAPILAERTTYWPGASTMWLETHASHGTPQLGTAWLMAGGEVGGAQQYETHVAIAHPGATPGTATITLLRDGAAPLRRTVSLPAESRVTVGLGDFGLQSGERFGILVESQAPIVVERTTLWSAEGWQYRGGTSVLGRRLR